MSGRGDSGCLITEIRSEILPDPANPQLFVHVTDDEGGSGTGETWWGTYQPSAPPGTPVAAIAALVDTLLAPVCVGARAGSVGDIAELWQRLVRSIAQYGPEGITSTAISGIDLALWDLLGRRAGTPVADLLGSRRDHMPPCYASLDWLGDVDAVLTAARAAVDAGFSAVKLHEADPGLIAEVRAALPATVGVMVDVSGRWDEPTAAAAVARLAGTGLTWIEEPLYPYQDHRALRRFRDMAGDAGIPVAAGENEFGLAGFERLLESGAVDVLQPDLVKCGGLTPAAAIAEAARNAGVVIAPHNFSLGPSLCANVAWAAVTPEVGWLEVPWLNRANSFPSGVEPPVLTAGSVPPPSAPGLG
jgi:D-galactarolactone cycloisomerase